MPDKVTAYSRVVAINQVVACTKGAIMLALKETGDELWQLWMSEADLNTFGDLLRDRLMWNNPRSGIDVPMPQVRDDAKE